MKLYINKIFDGLSFLYIGLIILKLFNISLNNVPYLELIILYFICIVLEIATSENEN